MITVLAATTIVCYTMYTVAPETAGKFGGHNRLIYSVPFVVFGLGRYLQLLHRHDAGEEPENVLLGDWPILATVAGWAVTCAAILVVS